LKEFAVAEDRTVSWVVGFALKQFFVARQANAADVSAALKRDPSPDYGKLSGRQVDIETAIAAVVKRGPVKPAKHK
jgi:predicted transcriptional regulator